MTIGMLLVAFFAASAADPAGATIRSTLSRTSSAARAGSRSIFPSAHRYSMIRFWPSTQPSCRNARKKAWSTCSTDARVGALRVTDPVRLARLLRKGGERCRAEGKWSKNQCESCVTSVHPISRRSSRGDASARIVG